MHTDVVHAMAIMSVGLSVTLDYCLRTAKYIITLYWDHPQLSSSAEGAETAARRRVADRRCWRCETSDWCAI